MGGVFSVVMDFATLILGGGVITIIVLWMRDRKKLKAAAQKAVVEAKVDSTEKLMNLVDQLVADRAELTQQLHLATIHQQETDRKLLAQDAEIKELKAFKERVERLGLLDS